MPASSVLPDRLLGPLHSLGNTEFLGLHKVAFLCSRNFPEQVARRSSRWACLQRDRGVCVISGFHSPVEKDVLLQLLKGSQPVIVALARGMKRPLEAQLSAAVDAGRLLIITRYAESVTHACEQKCLQRNRLMIELADEVVIAHAAPGGNLERLCQQYRMTKRITPLEEHPAWTHASEAEVTR